jgi:hypothetical protein
VRVGYVRVGYVRVGYMHKTTEIKHEENKYLCFTFSDINELVRRQSPVVEEKREILTQHRDYSSVFFYVFYLNLPNPPKQLPISSQE